jgi:hypothetical protein
MRRRWPWIWRLRSGAGQACGPDCGPTTLTRRQFERLVDALDRGTTVVMEACGTAH